MMHPALALAIALLPAAMIVPGHEPADDSPAFVRELIDKLSSTTPRQVNQVIFYDAPSGPNWRKALHVALDSAHLQQRHAAAQLLRKFPEVPASERLIAVTVDGLRNDTIPGKQVEGVRLAVANAAGFGWLIEHIEATRGALVPALASDDLQQRFLAAVCLGATADRDHVARIAQILIPHLRDNQIAGDALMAGCALYRLGPAARTALTEARAAADAQQGQIIDLILFDLANPPRSEADFKKRKGMQTVWGDLYDPIAWFKPQDLEIGWRGTMTEARRDVPGPLTIGTNQEAEEQVGDFNSITVQVSGTVDTGRKNGVYLVGPGLDLWLTGLTATSATKHGASLTVRGTLEWFQWPDAQGTGGEFNQTKSDARGKGLRELVLRVQEK